MSTNYDFGFNSQTWHPTKSVGGYAKNTYGNPTTALLMGYITSTPDANVLQDTYSVFIPEYQVEASAILAREVGSTYSNGIGTKILTPQVGTPVLVSFIQGKQLVILNAINSSGSTFGSDLVASRELPKLDAKGKMWRSPIPNCLLELGVDSSCTVSPFEIRFSGGNYQFPVTTGLAVPGSIQVNSPKGVTYSVVPNANITQTGNSFTNVQGKQKSYSDKANESMQFSLEKVKVEVEDKLKREFAFANGDINPKEYYTIVSTLMSGGDSDVLNTSDIQSVLKVALRDIDDAVEVALNFAQLGDSFVQLMNQDMAVILSDLLDHFGRFDLDLGFINLDFDLSLTSIDANVNFRIGTGLPLADRLVNKTLDIVANVVLDNLLNHFSIGEFLNLNLESLEVDPDSTYVENLFTPILRMSGSLAKPMRLTDFIPSNFSLDQILKFESEYATSAVYLDPGSGVYSEDKVISQVQQFLVQVTGDISLIQLPEYLDRFNTFNSEEDLIAVLTYVAIDLEDKLRLLFLYGYYTQSLNKVSLLATLMLSERQVSKLFSTIDFSLKESYLALSNYVSAGAIYNPLDLSLASLTETLVNPVTVDSILNFEVGQLLSYFTQVILIRSGKDLRVGNLDLYLKLQVLISKAWSRLEGGYSPSTT